MGIKCQDSRTIKVRNLNATFWYQQGGRNVISTNDSLSHNTTLLVWALPGIQMWLCFIFLQIQIGLRCELWFNFLSRGPNTPGEIFAILPRSNRPQNFSSSTTLSLLLQSSFFTHQGIRSGESARQRTFVLWLTWRSVLNSFSLFSFLISALYSPLPSHLPQSHNCTRRPCDIMIVDQVLCQQH